MYLTLRVNGQTMNLDMEQTGNQVLSVGEYRYRPVRIARRVRKLAMKLWGHNLTPDVLGERLCFEAMDDARIAGSWVDSGIFSPSSGSVITLGKWDENATIGIALHELAHDLHWRHGGYDESEGVVREALSLLSEREAGLIRTFDREPYYTASNLVDQLCSLWSFRSQPFRRRWDELTSITVGTGLADLVNYYLDRDEGLGLARWLRRYSQHVDVREALLNALAACSLRYSLEYRRTLIDHLIRCNHGTPLEQLLQAFESVITLDQRYPDDDLNRIIDFCFAPLTRARRGLFAFG